MYFYNYLKIRFKKEGKIINRKTIYKGTPTISVIDNRGLEVRKLKYNRSEIEEEIEEYISRNTYTLLGNIDSSYDARLFSKFQSDKSVSPNIKYITSLRGEVLLSKSVDSGRNINFYDVEGKLNTKINAKNIKTSIKYDISGRPTTILESKEDKTRVIDKFIYGEEEINAKENNLRGKLLRHYDSAGLVETESFSISGMPLSESRQLLKNMEEPINWDQSNEDNCINLLENKVYTTNWEYDAQGKVLSQKDAKGNITKTIYNELGKQESISIKLQGEKEENIIDKIKYNVSGQIERVEAKGEIVSEYIYENATQRLIRKKDYKKLVSGKKKILNNYCYEYDPVGNVLSIINDMDSVKHYKNQVISLKREYKYDALYQLISSSGRECHTSTKNNLFPYAISPIPKDDSQYVNYKQTYNYDKGGNLIKLKHKGASSYTRNIFIDENSNRGINKEEGETLNFENFFDRAGNQKYLLPSIPIEWDTKSQLSCVQMVRRENEYNDNEKYYYDSSGIRIVKDYIKKAQNTKKTGRTIYLNGLELRTHKVGEVLIESLQVITIGQVRILHWEEGTKPKEIENNQYRYSINDHLGSSLLEVDSKGQIISKEEYYPYGGTAIWTSRTKIEASYKTIRYSKKELDATGLYYFGSRYYIPWLGRWLNPDPQGIIDGLNLYRMSRNNPITLMDPDGNSPIDPNDFNSANGDLIYGLVSERERYASELGAGRSLMGKDKRGYAVLYHAAYYIDHYNNEIIEYITKKDRDNVSLAGRLGFAKINFDKNKKAFNNPYKLKEFASDVKVPDNLKDKLIESSLPNQYPLYNDYFRIENTKEKFNISNIFNQVANNYDKDMYHCWYYSPVGLLDKSIPVLQTGLLWKRGSKLGLEIAARSEKTKIHFVLDGINIDDVVNKVKTSINGEVGNGESISSSELRYAYRNRERLGNRVIFYNNLQKVSAPWVSNPSLWNNYKAKGGR